MELSLGKSFQLFASIAQLVLHQRRAALVDQQIENDVQRGRLVRELAKLG